MKSLRSLFMSVAALFISFAGSAASTLRTWMTVDLTTGLVSYHDYDFATATNTFNTEEYKSTKMAFRRIEAGDSYYVQNGAYTAQMTNAYYIGLFEVTVAQYELIKDATYVRSGSDALRTQGGIRRETVRGNKSAPSAFGALITSESPLGQLNARVQAAMGSDKLVFDLPTEAMWEVAARAVDSGDETQKTWNWHFGETKANLDLYAFWGSKSASDNYGNTSGLRVPGCKLPNAWGLYDMYGNAAEICLDGAEGYNLPDASQIVWSETPQVSGDGDAALKYRNQRTRGGHYESDAADASSLNRCHQTNSNYAWCGIRLALICLDEVVPVPPGGDIDVPSGYESATDFAEALNDGTANKADYLKAPGGVTTTDMYLSYFSAVPSGEATVAFVLNGDGTNAVEAATEVAATNALAVALSPSVTTLTIADPLVGFYYSLKQGGAVTNLLFNAEGDRNKLGGSVPINFDLIKPEDAGFYQPIVTPTEYGD